MDEEIRTVRTPKTGDRPYFSMARETAQDKRLSWEARGVLAYLLSKPDDWQVVITDLQQECGRDKVKKILKELEDCHYLKVHRRQHGRGGKFTHNEYQVFEVPFTEKPSTVKPSTENPLLHIKELQITELTEEKEQKNAATSAATPPKSNKPKKPGYNVKRWSLEQVNDYWTSHSVSMCKLITACGYPEELCGKMSDSEKRIYITAHRDLMTASFDPDQYQSLFVYAKNKSWKAAKGGMPVTDLASFVTDYRNMRLAQTSNPAPKPPVDWSVLPKPGEHNGLIPFD